MQITLFISQCYPSLPSLSFSSQATTLSGAACPGAIPFHPADTASPYPQASPDTLRVRLAPTVEEAIGGSDALVDEQDDHRAEQLRQHVERHLRPVGARAEHLLDRVAEDRLRRTKVARREVERQEMREALAPHSASHAIVGKGRERQYVQRGIYVVDRLCARIDGEAQRDPEHLWPVTLRIQIAELRLRVEAGEPV